MKIKVITAGNRSLYRSTYQSIDNVSHHRTATGAARALLKAHRKGLILATTCGDWGYYTLEIDGRLLSSDERFALGCAVERAIDDRNWADPVTALAKQIDMICND